MKRGITRWGVTAIAAGRLGIGLVAVVRPELAARSWLGRAADGDTAARVLGRALGGRDVALALGALRADDPVELRRWVGLGGLADAVDAVATIACWSALGKVNRVMVLVAAAGAAVLAGVAVVAPSPMTDTSD